MSVSVYGFDDGMEQEPGARLAEAADSGLVTFTESRRGTTAQATTLFNTLERQTTAHPVYVNLKLESKVVFFDAGGQGVVNLVWAGSDAGSGTPALPDAVWKLSRSPSQEPIDTHPDFALFAGTPETPLNGAEFDPETGLFIGFKSANPNVFGGVTKYLEFGAVLTKISVTTTSPNTNQEIPRIDTPSGSTITVPEIDGRNWMKTDLSTEREGSIYKTFEEWTMSGQQGWNSDIYP